MTYRSSSVCLSYVYITDNVAGNHSQFKRTADLVEVFHKDIVKDSDIVTKIAYVS